MTVYPHLVKPVLSTEFSEYLAKKFAVSLSYAEKIVTLHSGIESIDAICFKQGSPFIRLKLRPLIGMDCFGVANIRINPASNVCRPNFSSSFAGGQKDGHAGECVLADNMKQGF